MSPLEILRSQRLTVKEIAARDRVGEAAVRARIGRGEYPGARLEGRGYLIPAHVMWTRREPEPAPEVTAAVTAAAAALAAARAWRCV